MTSVTKLDERVAELDLLNAHVAGRVSDVQPVGGCNDEVTASRC